MRSFGIDAQTATDDEIIMLDALRKGAGSWIAKIFIGILVLSFAVWGIADIFRGYGGRSLAMVGETEISAEEYRTIYNAQLQSLSRRFGRALTSQEARALGLDRNVLQVLIGNAAVDSHANSLKLGVTDEAIIQSITRDRRFQDAFGSFNRVMFDQAVRSVGLTEQGYVARQRRGTVRNQIQNSLVGEVALPKTMVSAINRYRNERRKLKYFVLNATQAGDFSVPTDSELKKFYETRKSAFTAPEYRKLGVLILSPELIEKTIEITDKDLKAQYDAHKNRYVQPERRRIQRIAFQDMEKAQKAYDKIKGGADFVAVAKELGFSERDIDRGLVAKAGLIDPAIRDAAFKLKKDEVSTPVQGKLAIVLLRVTSITAAVDKTYEQVKEDIRKDLQKRRARDEVLDMHDAVEDERAGGATLAEIAKKKNLKFVQIPAVDSRGNGEDGKPVAALSKYSRVVPAAFQSDVGVENDPVETSDRGYVWLDVEGVTPSKLKPLKDIRAQVEKRWKENETRNRLAKKGQELAKRIQDGATIDAVAKELELAVKETKMIKRSGASGDLTRAAVSQAFTLAKNGASSAAASKPGERVIFQVADIDVPKISTAKMIDPIKRELRPQIADDVFSQYVTGLRDRFGVSINQQVFRIVTGQEQPARGSR